MNGSCCSCNENEVVLMGFCQDCIDKYESIEKKDDKEEVKKFSQELLEQNDGIAKLLSINFLESTGKYKLIVPLNEQKEAYKEYDFQMFDYINNINITVEVERKKVWVKKGKWQGWNTLDVPFRKKDSHADIYIMVNNSCDTIAATKMKRILDSPTSYKKTIYTTNEKFFNVELKEFNFYYKNDTIWNQFNALNR